VRTPPFSGQCAAGELTFAWAFIPQTDITAIYNSNAVFAYILSIYLLRSERWETFKVVSVVFACAGVFIIAYGDSDSTSDHVGIGSRLLGNLLALFGSVSYGFYEVWYKKYGSCPHEIIQRHSVSPYDAVLHRRTSSRALLRSSSVADDPSSYHGVVVTADNPAAVAPLAVRSPPPESSKSAEAKKKTGRVSVTDEIDELDVAEADGGRDGDDDDESDLFLSDYSEGDEGDDDDDDEQVEQASPTLMLTHANLITTLIGAFTFCVFWIPIPILHWFHVEVRPLSLSLSLPPFFSSVLSVSAAFYPPGRPENGRVHRRYRRHWRRL
jgi:hypothetical protein